MYNDGDNGRAEVRVYRDKHGLPVLYDGTPKQEKQPTTPDELSVLWHELLSPLTVIKGYTGTLLELNDAITEEQRMQYVRGIAAASDRMIRLLENLRDISRLEETDSLLTRFISISEVLRPVVSEMQRQTNQHILKITPSERLPLVKAEPEKIEQVFTNLITNAIKYSPEGGEITVEAKLVRDEHDRDTMFDDAPEIKMPCLVMSVVDEGIGLPEDETERIFERFYRVNNQVIKSTPGAGLGLYICRKIVEGHGGHIWARNCRQGGSVFHFSLPLERSTTRRYQDCH